MEPSGAKGSPLNEDTPLGVFENTLYYSANFGNRDYLVPSGFVERDLTSYERVHGHDQAFVVWDEDVGLESGKVYGCEVSVEKGEVEVVGLLGGGKRGAVVEFDGTLKEINAFARNVVFYPEDGESGWSKFVVKVKDLVDDVFCEGFVGGECVEGG